MRRSGGRPGTDRRFAPVGRWIAVVTALLAGLLSPVVAGPAPVAAHTGFTSIADDSNADISPDPTINGIPMKVRVLRPDSDQSKPTDGWPLVVYMAGDLKNRCANVNESSTRTSWYTRKQMVEHGFAVLSFNARGTPANWNAGANPSGTSGCSATGDTKDMINDSGWDLGGSNDKGDIKGLIDWAANHTWSGCSSSCIDETKVGLFGYGTDGLKSLLMGVPNPPNTEYSSGVKGIVAVGYEELTVRNLKDLSSDGAATPTFRKVDHGNWAFTPDFHSGYFGVADESVAPSVMELIRDDYLNETVSDDTKDWFDDRTILDDTASVDKAEEIDTPVFLANAWLDDAAGTSTATLAYNKLGATDKYLYLGACGSGYGQLAASASGPCLTTNASNLRDKVHAFLDRHVKGDTGVSVGGPVFWAVPPATNPLSTDSWTVDSDPDATWPPAPDAFTSTTCLGSDGAWYSGSCSSVSQPTGDRTITNTWTTLSQSAFCAGSTYGATEVVSYTSGADPENDLKLIGFELDLHMKSDTTRLQVYADLYDITVGPPEVETRIWQGSAQMVPVKRDGTAGTVYRFKFKPAGVAWTLKANHKLRLKIAANYKKSFVQELLPATYTIKHTDTEPSHFYLTFDF